MNAEMKESQFMLVKNEQKFSLKRPLQKILGFAPMFNNTFVVLGIKALRYETVAHYDAQGNLLKQHVFRDSNLFSYVVPSDREIIWVDSDRDFILQWNLETDQLLEFPYIYNNDTGDSHEVFIFPETKLICIAEWGSHNSNFLRFVYYKYPLTKDSEPVYRYQDEEVWNYKYTIKRANTRSMMLWWKTTMKKEINFKTFQLIQKDGKYLGEYRQHKAKNEFKASSGKTCQLSVGSIWQMVPKKYLIVSITDRPHTETEWPNALFVYEEKGNIFREAKFAFEGKYRFQHVHYYSFGTTAMIRSFNFIRGQPQQTPIYYIDNIGQQIAAVDKWHCTYKNKFSMPGYDPNVIVDAEYQNGYVDSIKSTVVKVKAKKIIREHYQLEEKLTDIIDSYTEKIDEKFCENVYDLLSENIDQFYKEEERKYQTDPLYEYQ